MNYLENKAKVLTVCIFLWWTISPFIIAPIIPSTDSFIGIWVSVGCGIGVYINSNYPEESVFYTFRTMMLLGLIVGIGATIYGFVK